MIRTVIQILKKHLDQGRDEFNTMNDMLSLTTNYDMMAWPPSYTELRLLSRELISTIGDVKMADLITVPSVDELKTALMAVLPIGPYRDDIAADAAGFLHEWLVRDRPVDMPLGHCRGIEIRDWAARRWAGLPEEEVKTGGC